MRVLWIGIAALALAAAGARAQEERAIDHFAGVGVRAMGMGGAFVGVADDFSAVYWNPAGLVQMEQFEVYMSFLRNRFANEADQAGAPASADLENTRFGSLGIVLPYPVYRGSLVFAAGFNRIKDFDYALRIEGFDRAASLQVKDLFTHEGEIALTSLAGAVDVAPSVSLGAALNFLTGEDQAVNQFEWLDSEDRFEEKRFLARDTFEDDYQTALSATLGAMVRAPRDKPKARLGATLTSGATHRVRYRFKGVPSETGYNLVEFDDGRVQENPPEEVRGGYKIALPLEFGIGASYLPIPGLLLGASAHFAGWSQTEYRDEDENELRANAAFETQYKDATRYHLGVEWQVPVVALDLRAGFYTDPLVFAGPRDPSLSVDPIANPLIIARQDRRFFTAGAGLLFEEVVRADLAWTHGSFERVEGELQEDAATDRVMVGVSCRF